MRHRAVATPIMLLLCAGLTAPALAQSGGAPRTAWGDPDLGGTWVNNAATPLERPDAFGDKAELSDEELAALRQQAAEVLDGDDAFFGDDFINAALADDKGVRSFDQETGNYNQFWLSERNFENRTSLIVDPPTGKLPALTPDAQARVAAELEQLFAPTEIGGPEQTSLPVRCITFGIPNLFAGYNSYVQVLQTPDHIAFRHELIHETRIVPLVDSAAVDDDLRQWHGVSRGHWEGDALVVETTNYSPATQLLIPGAGAGGSSLTLEERFTRVAPDTLRWEITFNDPTTWTQPWTAVMLWQQDEQPIFEYACHEGNYSMEGILAGARLGGN